MPLDTAAATAKLRSLTHKFDEAVMNANPFYPTVCTEAPSDGADEEYGWLGAMPGVREWLGDRQFHTLRAANFTLANKEWESSVEIERTRIEDDRLGIYKPILSAMGTEAALHPDELLVNMIEAGDATACFDGQFFFDTDHAWAESGANDNDLSVGVTAAATPTPAEFKGAFEQAVNAMLGFTNDQGKKMHRPVVTGLSGLTCIVPLGLRNIATTAFESKLLGGGDTNVVLDKPKVVCIPNLSSGVKFWVLKTDTSMRPFVWQPRRALQRQMKGMNDREFKDVKFMTDSRYNLGYLAWWNAVQVTLTTN